MFNQRLLGLRSPQISVKVLDLMTGGAIIDNEGSAMDEYDIDRDMFDRSEDDAIQRVPDATLNPDPVYEEQTYDGVDEDALLQQALNMTQPSTSHRENENPFGNVMRNITGLSAYSARHDLYAPNSRFDSLTSQNDPIERGMIGLPNSYPPVVDRVIKKSQDDVKRELQRERISRYTSGPSTSYDMYDEDGNPIMVAAPGMDRDIFFKQDKIKPKTVDERREILIKKIREDLDAPIAPGQGGNTVQTTYFQILGSAGLEGKMGEDGVFVWAKLTKKQKKDIENAAIETELLKRKYEFEMPSRSLQRIQDTRFTNPLIERDIVEPTSADQKLRRRLATMTPEQIEQMSFIDTEFDLENMSIDNYLDNQLGDLESSVQLPTSGNMVNPYRNMTDYEILQLYENMDELKKNGFDLDSVVMVGKKGKGKGNPITIAGEDLTNDNIIYIGGILEKIKFIKKSDRNQSDSDFFNRYRGKTDLIINERKKLLDGKISTAQLRYIEMRAKTLMGIPTYTRKSRLDIPVYDELDDEELEVQEQYESIREFLPDDVDLEAMDLEEIDEEIDEIDDPLDVEGIEAYADEMNQVIESAKRETIDIMEYINNLLRQAIGSVYDYYLSEDIAAQFIEINKIVNKKLKDANSLIDDYGLAYDVDINRIQDLYNETADEYNAIELEAQEIEEEEEETKEEDLDNLIESKEDDESVKRKRGRPRKERSVEVINLVSDDEEEEPVKKKSYYEKAIISFNDDIKQRAIQMNPDFFNLNEFYDDVWNNEITKKKQGRKIQKSLNEIDKEDKKNQSNEYNNRLRALQNEKNTDFKRVVGEMTSDDIVKEYINDMIEDKILKKSDRNRKLDAKGRYIAHLYVYNNKKNQAKEDDEKEDDDKEGSGMKSKFKVIKL